MAGLVCGKKEREGRLTLRTLLIENLPSNNLGLDNYINLLLSRNIPYISFRATVVPRVPAKCLPDTDDGSISRNINAVGGEDVVASGTDIKQIGLGLGIRSAARNIMEHKCRRSGQRRGQDVVLSTSGESSESSMAGCGEDVGIWERTRGGDDDCQRAGGY